MTLPPRSEIVLVGGGHAHVQVVRRWMMDPVAGVRLTWVLDRPVAVYSGMVPGFVAGSYERRELEIDCVPLGRRAGARLILAAATGLDPGRSRLAIAGRPAIAYDAISFDVGSTVRGLDLPGVRAHALATRPIASFIDALEDFAHAGAAGNDGGGGRLAIVGGGAAGAELAFTLGARLGEGVQIDLVTEADALVPGASRGLRRRVERALARRVVAVRTGARVEAVEADGLRLAGGERHPADRVVWATGAAPLPLLAELGLARDPSGFLEVRDTLQSVDRDEVFAVGDCAALVDARWVPKAGVHAVREGPTLDRNLRAFLAGRRLTPHRPQRDFLALLTMGHGRAIGGKWGVAAEGRAIFRLKDRIDRRFMERFQVLAAAGGDAAAFPTPESMGMDAMACGGCAAKVGAGGLARALARLGPAPPDPRVVLGLGSPDDTAAVTMPGGDTLLATVDGFRAFTDDPWLVGRVAAENAASDVDATGGIPRHALAWVTVPEGPGAEETLFQVMSGVREVLDRRQVSLVGGHSTTGPELAVGLAILGELRGGEALLPKAGVRKGDRLVLTKPLGTGVVLAADMQGRATGAWVRATHASMLRGNARAAAAARRFGAHALTDVSGFGLAVHLGEMLEASDASAGIDPAALPALPGARELLARGLRSTFHPQNVAAAAGVWGPATDPECPDHALCVDPQTSGGLVIALPPDRAEGLVEALRTGGDTAATVFGSVGPPAEGAPRLRLEG